MQNEVSSLKIADTVIYPGEKAIVNLKLPSLYTNYPIDIPVHVIKGKLDGPVLLVTSTIHGDEINGIEIIRKLIKSVKEIRGTLIAVPIMNVYGFINLSRYLPDNRDLNRSFPGSKKGSLAARLANTYVKNLLCHATHIIDLHTGAKHRANLPQIRIDLSEKNSLKLAKAFNAPVIVNSIIREGSIRYCAKEFGIPSLVYESGEALRFDDKSIKAGVQGILRVMDSLNMIAKGAKKPVYSSVIAHSSIWIRSPKSGIVRPKIKLGDKVFKNQFIGNVIDPFGGDIQEIIAPYDGVIIGTNSLPLVHEGDALFHLASFKKIKLSDMYIPKFREEDLFLFED